jgi:hypothetical protein
MMREIFFNGSHCIIDSDGLYRDFNYVAAGDFDGDGFDEVVLGDSDGQLVIVKVVKLLHLVVQTKTKTKS